MIKNGEQLGISQRNFDLFVKHFARLSDVQRKDLLGKNKERDVLEARRIFAFALYDHFNMTIEDIAKVLEVAPSTTTNYLRDALTVLSDGTWKTVYTVSLELFEEEREGQGR